MTMFWLGSPPPRIVIGQSGRQEVLPGVPKLYVILIISTKRSDGLPQHNAMGNFAGGDHAPEGDE